jgi:hypothetical protein
MSAAVGQPIVDAYFLEQEQEWVGAALRGEKFSRFKGLDSFADRLVSYAVPTKTRASPKAPGP